MTVIGINFRESIFFSPLGSLVSTIFFECEFYLPIGKKASPRPVP